MSEELERWRFKNVDNGEIIYISTESLEKAWKELEEEYSDPLHAWQEWIALDN